MPSEAELRARRLRAGVAEAERMLGSTAFGFAELARAARTGSRACGADGGGASPTRWRRAPRGSWSRAAEAELDHGEIEAGVAHYRVALALDAHARRRGGAGGGAAHAREVGAVGATRTPRRSAGRARRWRSRATIRKRTRCWPTACTRCARTARRSTEYGKALSARPDDRTFTHSLSTARHALAAETAAAKRDHATQGAAPPPGSSSEAAAAETAAPSPPSSEPTRADDKPAGEDKPPARERPATRTDDSAEKPAPSAPAEPAPDQQQ